jgi:hypothetical protein
MSLREKMLKQLSCYFEGKGFRSQRMANGISIILTPEQGLLKLSPDFLELKIPVDCGSEVTPKTVAWILKSLIEAGHDSEFIMDFSVDDDGDLDFHWRNSSGHNWSWMVRNTILPASTIRDVFGLPEEEAQSGYRFGPGTLRGDFAEDFEVVCHVLKRHYKRFWHEMSEGDDSSNSMPIGKQKELLNRLLEAERCIEAAAKELRG